MKTRIATKIDGQHVWRVSPSIVLWSADMKTVEVYEQSEYSHTMPHKEAQQHFGVWLYPAGSVVFDESNRAKILRRREREGYYLRDIEIPREPV